MRAMLAALDRLDKPRQTVLSEVPLVLIHDGGGTHFQYYLLGPLGRRTYGIANPYFNAGGRPPGGIAQLGLEYATAIKATLGNGPILVGGWSFGGLIALEVARLLQNESAVRVKGLLLIDSACPWDLGYKTRQRARPQFLHTTRKETKEKIDRCFDAARHMILEWERPTAFNPPPCVLIRATDPMALVDTTGEPSDGVDGDERLGWSAYNDLTILSVMNVPGNHFTMFADDRLDNITQVIRDACGKLEEELKFLGQSAPRD